MNCGSFWRNLGAKADTAIASPVTPAGNAPAAATPSLNPTPQPQATNSATTTPTSVPNSAPTASPPSNAAEQPSATAAAAEQAAAGSDTDVDCTTGTCPDCEIITGGMLANVYNNATAAQRDIAAKELNWFINRGQLDSELRLAHFLGQTRQETAGHILKTENLNYKVAVLKAKFGYYSNNPEKADAHGRVQDKNGKVTQAADQEAIANHAYANRIGNGNIASGDGWRYRGRGIKQLTGRGNYKSFTTGHEDLWLEKKDFEAEPELLATDAKYAVRSGIWFWVNHNLGLKADGGGTKAVADRISTVVNAYDGAAGFTNRFNYMKEILDAGTFKNVCFNKSLATRNEKAWQPFGNNGR